MAAIEAVLKRAGKRPADVTAFSHGMTVATNALLEGRGARTALIATEGFTDVVALGRQNRPDLYRLCEAWPPPLVPSQRRFGAPERMTPEGPLHPLIAEAALALARTVAQSEPEAVGVVLLHSYRHPEHETAIGEALGQVLPDAHVSLSHDVVGTFREFERATSTEVDAALSPLLASYLRRLVERAQDAGIPEPAIMQSNGGLIDVAAAAGHASWTVLSGPAGGAAGAAFAAREAGAHDALCFDMGGTSCDVCVVEGGSVQEQSAGEIAGRPLALPMLAVHTVGAGGGSVAWRDPGGALRVGPRSAGADPGPACYGRGGTEPTVTDAYLVLGYLGADSPLAGEVRLRPGGRRARDRGARPGARSRATPVCRGNHPGCQCRDGARAAGGHRAARNRSTSLRAARVRRCGPIARRTDRRRTGDRHDPLSGRIRRAGGARPGRLPGPARRAAERVPRRRGADTRGDHELGHGARRIGPAERSARTTQSCTPRMSSATEARRSSSRLPAT